MSKEPKLTLREAPTIGTPFLSCRPLVMYRKIASFLENKSVEDVVRFYFKYKMRLNLKQALKENATRRRANNGTRSRLAAAPGLGGFPVDTIPKRSICDNLLHEE